MLFFYKNQFDIREATTFTMKQAPDLKRKRGKEKENGKEKPG